MIIVTDTKPGAIHVVFGAGKVRHLVDEVGDGGDRIETFCRMFYAHQVAKVRVVDPADERTAKLPLCGACLRTPKAKLAVAEGE